MDPKECPNCQLLICNQCITQNKFTCPNRCNNNLPLNFVKINRIVNKSLERSKYKCCYDDECEFEGKYLTAIQHLSDCEFLSAQCPLNCG